MPLLRDEALLQRGRDAENDVSLSYLQQLETSMREWAKQADVQHRLWTLTEAELNAENVKTRIAPGLDAWACLLRNA